MNNQNKNQKNQNQNQDQNNQNNQNNRNSQNQNNSYKKRRRNKLLRRTLIRLQPAQTDPNGRHKAKLLSPAFDICAEVPWHTR